MQTSRAWEQVLSRIESDLLSGRLTAGDHLPPERTLAAELAVGRSSVREAVRALEILGLVRTATGSGPNAGAVLTAHPARAMSSLIRLQVAGGGFDVAHVVSTRIVLEREVARGLASRRAEMHAPRTLLSEMDSTTSPESFLSLDAAFHLSLADSSGNAVIAAVMAGLRDSIRSYVTSGAQRLADWGAVAERLQLEHRRLLELIEAGEADAAEVCVSEHIDRYYSETNLISATHRT